MKKITLSFILLLLNVSLCFAQAFNIIPTPVKLKTETGTFTISASTQLILNDSGEQQTADFLNDYLQRFYGFKLNIVKQASTNFVRLNTLRFIKTPDSPGHYTFGVKPESISIEGDSYQGTFYGMQTLLQMLPVTPQQQITLPCVSIDDYPRFSYRGMHLDVDRHFFPIEFVKKYIDYIALHKMNTFHWHLTDDQGWRIEIRKYPKLTSVGGYRNGTIIGRYPGKGNDSVKYGGFYTQDEIRAVVKYAAERFITVIPEIEMPGHASAAIAAYPELSCFPEQPTAPAKGTTWSGSSTGKQVQQAWGVFNDVFCAGKEQTFTLLQGVLDEVIQLFPSTYIHIGGDESPKVHWKMCPNCQTRIKDNNLKDEHELQSYFIQRMEKYINSKGRQIIGWDEILEGGLAPNATVMSWRGENGGIEAATENHNVIMTPGNFVYFDHAQSKTEDSVTIGNFTPIEEVYSYEPVPQELDSTKARFILGAQANVWTEYMKNQRKVEYQIFPRMAALSEVLWSPKEKRNFADFETRLPNQFARYNLWGANYSGAYYGLKSTVSPTPANDGVWWKLESKSKAPIFITYSKSNTGMRYTDSIRINGSNEVEAAVVDKGKAISSLTLKFNFNKATGKKINLTSPPSPTYPGSGAAFGLVNGLVSQTGFNSAEWLGWIGKNMEAFIDLGKPQQISSVSVDVWKQEPSGIYLPKSLVVFTSENGKDWDAGTTATPVNGTWPNERTITVNLNNKPVAKQVRIVAENYGIIPAARQLAGTPAWLFVDEIIIE
jgi:hexosaminidase